MYADRIHAGALVVLSRKEGACMARKRHTRLTRSVNAHSTLWMSLGSDYPVSYYALSTPIEDFNREKSSLAVRHDRWDAVDGWSLRGQHSNATSRRQYSNATSRGQHSDADYDAHANAELDRHFRGALANLAGCGHAKPFPEPEPEPEEDSTSEPNGYESDEQPSGTEDGMEREVDEDAKNEERWGALVEEIPATARETRVEIEELGHTFGDFDDSDEDYDDSDEDYDTKNEDTAELVDGLLRAIGPRFHSTRTKRLAVVHALGISENDIISVCPRAIPP
ncbi:hypothetical protein PLICRDRAFT_32392 [Plicaturopsis crispa FD-325 SS-3]|uniref:Uncharacterized protein n=1 Tax=Plicaturopsis crispa FD-325 SS-3 TaxID=944288 RepID=A0A0C9T4U4_PLICR|nr:hypothetical protein PLICRDRAFT_32392 [Plicaturopsis crispa FD-325 SS-3]